MNKILRAAKTASLLFLPVALATGRKSSGGRVKLGLRFMALDTPPLQVNPAFGLTICMLMKPREAKVQGQP
jgi:hypothetical protein